MKNLSFYGLLVFSVTAIFTQNSFGMEERQFYMEMYDEKTEHQGSPQSLCSSVDSADFFSDDNDSYLYFNSYESLKKESSLNSFEKQYLKGKMVEVRNYFCHGPLRLRPLKSPDELPEKVIAPKYLMKQYLEGKESLNGDQEATLKYLKMVLPEQKKNSFKSRKAVSKPIDISRRK